MSHNPYPILRAPAEPAATRVFVRGARLVDVHINRDIVAYCRGPWCVLSFEAVALLRNKGYRARRLEDGFPEWKMAGLPVS